MPTLVLETLEAVGGIYIAMFAIAVVSGVFPIVSSELALIGMTVALGDLTRPLVLAVIVAIGQTISHSTLFFAAREVTRVGAKKRAKLEARLAKARALVARWGDKWLLLIAAAALFGVPPMVLVSLAAGALGVRFRTLVTIGLPGRATRFIAIALGAHFI